MTAANRIAALESQVRTLKRAVYLFCGLFAAGLLVAATNLQSVPDVIRAKKFEVVNGEGKSIVVMEGLMREGVHYGFVTTLDSKGGTLVELNATTGGEGSVVTRNGKGQRLVMLGATTDGEGAVVTENGKGGTLVRLGTTTDGEGSVETQNGKGGTLVKLGVTTWGTGSVTTENGNGGPLVELGATTDGEGVVVTQNGKGLITSQAP